MSNIIVFLHVRNHLNNFYILITSPIWQASHVSSTSTHCLHWPMYDEVVNQLGPKHTKHKEGTLYIIT